MELSDFEYYREPSGVIYCGDCLEILPLLEPGSVDLVVTDPPYGVGKAKWDTIDYELVFPQLYNVMNWGASIYAFGAMKYFAELIISAKKHFTHLNSLVWLFPNGMNRLIDNWQICYDPIFYGKKDGKHIFNTDDIRFPYTEGTKKRIKSPVIKGGKEWKPNPNGRKPENVLVVPCLNHGSGMGERTDHPTQKPLDLIDIYIRASSDVTHTILDPFLGSGTTAVAAKQLGRKFIGIEIEEKYCEIAKQRLAQEELFNA